jgi:hypothetical protein
MLLGVVTVSPIAGIALWSIHRTVVDLADPCANWEDTSGDQTFVAAIGPHDVCRALSIHSGSKRRAAVIAAFVPGGMLAASCLAVVGLALSRRRVVLVGAAGMFAETIVSFSIAPVTLIVGIALLLLARHVKSESDAVTA